MACEASELAHGSHPTIGAWAPGSNEDCNQPVRILVVNDNLTARRTIVDHLESHNMRAVAVAGDQQVARMLAIYKPALVILDLPLGSNRLPELLCGTRSQAHAPIVITGSHEKESDRAVLLELGADDYLIKPFSLRELVARVRVILRRRKLTSTEPMRLCQPNHRRFGGWHVDLRARRVTDPNRIPVALTKAEYSLLVAFLARPQQPLTREHLLNATRVNEDVIDRSIDVLVMRLRRKLATDPKMQQIIRTERGIGYMFVSSVESF